MITPCATRSTQCSSVSRRCGRHSRGATRVPPATNRFLDATVAHCEELAQLLATGSRDPLPDAYAGAPHGSQVAQSTAEGESAGVSAPSAPSDKSRADRNRAASVDASRLHCAPAQTRILMTQPKILIADDEPAIAAGLSAILADLQYDVEIVGDGEQALERLSSERFGLVARRSQDAARRRPDVAQGAAAARDPDRVHHHHRTGVDRVRRCRRCRAARTTTSRSRSMQRS